MRRIIANSISVVGSVVAAGRPRHVADLTYVQETETTDKTEADWISNAKFVEFDKVKMDELPKSASVRKAVPSVLSDKEQTMLTEMIYESHYRSEATDGSDGVQAMKFQARLELTYLEEWAQQVNDLNQRRQAIKKAVLERCDFFKPLSLILGFQPFYGCHIDCVKPLLCPRPETESWTHWLTSQHLAGSKKPLNVLDVCSGTGCIGIAIAKHLPNATVVAVDILPEAVSVSNQNAARNQIPPSRYTCLQSDMFESLQSSYAAGHFDVLVSNPPYILPEQYESLPPVVKNWESKYALVGDPTREAKQYLYFKELCEEGARLLKPAASREDSIRSAPSIVIEVGLQADRIASIMERHPAWEDVELHVDFANQPRWIAARRK